jgi:hypothetical protein
VTPLFADLDRIHILGAIFSAVILITVFFLVRSRILKERHSLVWFFIGTFTLVMSLSDDLMDRYSAWIGVDYPPSALFALMIACSYLLLLNLSVSASDLKRNNKALTQDLGLLRLRVEELERKLDKAG